MQQHSLLIPAFRLIRLRHLQMPRLQFVKVTSSLVTAAIPGKASHAWPSAGWLTNLGLLVSPTSPWVAMRLCPGHGERISTAQEDVGNTGQYYEPPRLAFRC